VLRVSASVLRPSLFLEVTPRRLIVTDVSGQSIGKRFKGQSMIRECAGYPETSAPKYQPTPRNVRQEGRPAVLDLTPLRSAQFKELVLVKAHRILNSLHTLIMKCHKRTTRATFYDTRFLQQIIIQAS
jgi:hypothetical protein